MPHTLHIDWSKLKDALAMGDAFRSWLDRQTGEVLTVCEFERMEEDDPTREAIEADPARYLELPAETSRDGWAQMAEFVATVRDRGLRERLERSLQGRGAFRRFKDAVQEAGVAQAWYAFQGLEQGRALARWLRDHDIVPENPQPHHDEGAGPS